MKSYGIALTACSLYAVGALNFCAGGVVLAAVSTPARIQAPLVFEPGEDGHFLSRGPSYTFDTDCSDSIYRTAGSQFRMRISRARAKSQPEGIQPLGSVSNYLFGQDARKWRTKVPHYAKVRCPGVYAGIDLFFHRANGALEYDFVVAPGADPSVIRLRFYGAKSISINSAGDLKLDLPDGSTVTHRRPQLWQEIAGQKLIVDGRYTRTGNEVAFIIGAYRREAALVIDPVVVYSTLLGGSQGEVATGIAVDREGSVYITGTTTSADFPTTNSAYQRTLAGIRSAEAGDVFITKLNAQGTALVYSTYLGGSNGDRPSAIAVDASGNSYVTGYTYSANFPTTQGTVQPVKPTTSVAAFVTKLNSTGTGLLFSTYLGGARSSGGQEPAETMGSSIALDGMGNIMIGGFTTASDFPTTAGAYQRSFGGGSADFFISKLNATGTTMLYSTYIGGNRTEEGAAIAADSMGNGYLAGTTNSSNFPTTAGAFQTRFAGGNQNEAGDAVALKLNAAGNALIYSTYVGGIDVDFGTAIAVDTAGAAYIAGFTQSAEVLGKTRSPAIRGAFVTKLNVNGTGMAYSVFLDESGEDGQGPAIALDAHGNAYLTGFDSGGPLAVRIDPNGSTTTRATYLGPDERGYAIATAQDGRVFVAGVGNAASFGATTRVVQRTASEDHDSFVAQIDFSRPSSIPLLEPNAVVNGASFRPGPISPGEIVTVFGENFGSAELATLTINGTGRADTMLSNTRLLFDGVPAPLLYVTRNQLSAVVPYSLRNPFITKVQIEHQSVRSKPVNLLVSPSTPAIFTANSSGQGQAAALNQDFSLNSANTPARPGLVVMIFATGEGRVTPQAADGTIAGNSAPKPLLPVAVRIGGIPAEVLYAGGAPGLLTGVLQVNARVPEGVSLGDAVSIHVTVGTATSPDGVTIAVR